MPEKNDPEILITNILMCKAIDAGNKLPKTILRPLSLLPAQVTSFDMPSLRMLCNLAYVKNVNATDFLMVELDFKSLKMDLFDIRIRLGVSRSHSVRDKSTVLHLSNTKSGSGLILPEVTIESRLTTLKSLDLFRKLGNRQSPQPSSAISGH